MTRSANARQAFRPLAASGRWLPLLLLAGVVVACKPTAPPAAAPSAQPGGQPATSAAPTPDPAASTAGDGVPSAPGAADGVRPEIPVLRIATVDGKTFDLSQHRGQWVVVNFWATWCAPCRKEMPELSALDAMREHIDVVGLAYEEIDLADMQAFLKQHPVVYPVAILDVYAPPAAFSTPRGLPMTYLLSPDGRIARQFLGPVTAAEIDAAVAAGGGPATAG